MVDMRKGVIEIDYHRMATYLGHLVERIAIDYILDNRKSIIKQVYPNQSGLVRVQILKTDPDGNGKHSVGAITGSKGRYIIHGWNGDLVLLLHDEIYGKRAIVFEIKFGRGYISRSQHQFFKMASLGKPSQFMPKLADLKIFIFQCHSLNWNENKIDYKMHEYMPDKLKEYYHVIGTPISESKPKPKPVGIKKVKKKKKPKKRRLSIAGLKKYVKKGKRNRDKPVKKKKSLKVRSRRQDRRHRDIELKELIDYELEESDCDMEI